MNKLTLQTESSMTSEVIDELNESVEHTELAELSSIAELNYRTEWREIQDRQTELQGKI